MNGEDLMNAVALCELVDTVQTVPFRRLLKRLTHLFHASPMLPIRSIYPLRTIAELQIWEGDSRNDRFAKQFLALLLSAQAHDIDPQHAISDFLFDAERAQRTRAARR